MTHLIVLVTHCPTTPLLPSPFIFPLPQLLSHCPPSLLTIFQPPTIPQPPTSQSLLSSHRPPLSPISLPPQHPPNPPTSPLSHTTLPHPPPPLSLLPLYFPLSPLTIPHLPLLPESLPLHLAYPRTIPIPYYLPTTPHQVPKSPASTLGLFGTSSRESQLPISFQAPPRTNPAVLI